MITLLINLLIVVAILAIAWWAISMAPIPAPFRWVVAVIFAVIAIVLLLAFVGPGFGPGFHGVSLK